MLFSLELPFPNCFRYQYDRTAFVFACERCHQPVAAFLLEKKGVDVNEKDSPTGQAGLHRACVAGQTREQVIHPGSSISRRSAVAMA